MKIFLSTLLIVALANISWSVSLSKPRCGDGSSSKNIQLVNPKKPPRECFYTINAYSKYVCQLRIEFGFTLAQPSVPSKDNDLKSVQCDKDYFEAGDLKLCGSESSQHIYMSFNRTAGVKSIKLTIALANRAGLNNLPNPKWSIFVTQLECPDSAAIRNAMPVDSIFASSLNKDGLFLAPPGCLQYFPHTEGTVTSFNFNLGKGCYFGGLNYAICFHRTDKTKALVLKSNYFHLDVTNSQANKTDQNCLTNENGIYSDNLVIPQAEIEETGKSATTFYGSSLQAATIRSTNPGPLMLLFTSYDSKLKGTGFSFDYNIENKI